MSDQAKERAPSEILLDRDDVYVESAPVLRCECGEGVEDTIVMIDLRGNGTAHEVYRGCEECAQDFALRLQGSLPQSEESRE